MAAAQSRALVVMQDIDLGYFICEFNLNHLFAGRSDLEFPPILNLPEPVVLFNHGVDKDCLTIAVNGNLVVALASRKGQTLLYDTDSHTISAGPDTLSGKPAITLVPVADMFFAMSCCPHLDPKGSPHFELLLRLHDAEEEEENRSRWAWRPIPDPPLLSRPGRRGREWFISARFVAGAHIWVSFSGEGTFSFDTERRRWRREGNWVLPVCGRATLVPDFLGDGRQLLFGFCSREEGGHFCAVDMEARPPAIIKSWPEACVYQCQLALCAGYRAIPEASGLSYFGGGRFCISMHVITGYIQRKCIMTNTSERLPREAITLMAVEVTPELQLLKRKVECYFMPPGSTLGYMV
jgi:hypothetical protein